MKTLLYVIMTFLELSETVCSQCTFSNPAGAKACEMCEANLNFQRTAPDARAVAEIAPKSAATPGFSALIFKLRDLN